MVNIFACLISVGIVQSSVSMVTSKWPTNIQTLVDSEDYALMPPSFTEAEGSGSMTDIKQEPEQNTTTPRSIPENNESITKPQTMPDHQVNTTMLRNIPKHQVNTTIYLMSTKLARSNNKTSAKLSTSTTTTLTRKGTGLSTSGTTATSTASCIIFERNGAYTVLVLLGQLAISFLF